MEKHKLCELRKTLVEATSKFIELNNKYNELLAKTHENAVSKEKDPKVLKMESISKNITIVASLVFVLAFIFLDLPMISLLVYFLGYQVLYIVSETIIAPKIVYGKDYKINFKIEIKRKETEKKKEKVDMNALYDEVFEARRNFHKLTKEYEEMLSYLSDEQMEEYIEYLSSLDEYIELLESESTYQQQGCEQPVSNKNLLEKNLQV